MTLLHNTRQIYPPSIQRQVWSSITQKYALPPNQILAMCIMIKLFVYMWAFNKWYKLNCLGTTFSISLCTCIKGTSYLFTLCRCQDRRSDGKSLGAQHTLYKLFSGDGFVPQEIVSSTLHSWSNQTDSASLASPWLRLSKVNHTRSISMSYFACIIGVSMSEAHTDELLCISICRTCTPG